jgi:hypothetical protein
VRRVDDRGAAIRQTAEVFPQPLALPRVERGAGLVHQQHGRVRQQADRHVQSLPVTAREPRDLLVRAIRKPCLRQHGLHAFLHFADTLQAREQAQVLGHGQLVVERRGLRHPPGPLVPPPHGAGVGLLDVREDRQQGGLARAIRPDAGHALTGPHVQRDTP